MPDIKSTPTAGLPAANRTLLWLTAALPVRGDVTLIGVADVMVRFAPTSDLNYAAGIGDCDIICAAMALALGRIEAAGEQALDGVIALYKETELKLIAYKVRWLDGDTSVTIKGKCVVDDLSAQALADKMLASIAQQSELKV